MFLSPLLYIAKHSHHFLHQEDELLLVLMKLRINPMTEDLAIRFGISVGTVYRIQQRWLDVMYVRLKFLIVWSEREILRENIVKEFYAKCACIIDCTEIFIETPTNYKARAQTYSNY